MFENTVKYLYRFLEPISPSGWILTVLYHTLPRLKQEERRQKTIEVVNGIRPIFYFLLYFLLVNSQLLTQLKSLPKITSLLISTWFLTGILYLTLWQIAFFLDPHNSIDTVSRKSWKFQEQVKMSLYNLFEISIYYSIIVSMTLDHFTSIKKFIFVEWLFSVRPYETHLVF